jgi:hypothetical protein
MKRVELGGRNNPRIQRNSRSINLLSIQECIFGIRRIQGKFENVSVSLGQMLHQIKVGLVSGK